MSRKTGATLQADISCQLHLKCVRRALREAAFAVPATRTFGSQAAICVRVSVGPACPGSCNVLALVRVIRLGRQYVQMSSRLVSGLSLNTLEPDCRFQTCLARGMFGIARIGGIAMIVVFRITFSNFAYAYPNDDKQYLRRATTVPHTQRRYNSLRL